MQPMTALELGDALYDSDPIRYPYIPAGHAWVTRIEREGMIRQTAPTETGIVQFLPHRSANMVDIFEGAT